MSHFWSLYAVYEVSFFWFLQLHAFLSMLCSHFKNKAVVWTEVCITFHCFDTKVLNNLSFQNAQIYFSLQQNSLYLHLIFSCLPAAFKTNSYKFKVKQIV